MDVQFMVKVYFYEILRICLDNFALLFKASFSVTHR